MPENLAIPSKFYKIILAIMIIGFGFYNYHIYSCTDESQNNLVMSPSAVKGQQLWQKHNCVACHQFYGLGGYLGADLTNIASRREPDYIKVMVNSGIKSMPKFNLTEEENEQMVDFLEHIDATGFFPNKEADISNTGWVNLKYKTKK